MISVISCDSLNQILKSFKIGAACVGCRKVRNVSLYDLTLEPGTRVKQLQKFTDELSLALKAKSKPIVRIMPEIGIVRLEVLDEAPQTISFFDEFVLDKSEGTIPMYLGSAIDGSDLCIDFAKHPHTLIAGTTGSGKSTLLHTIVANALSIPNIKVGIIDSKNVEFGIYKNLGKSVSVADNFKSALNLLKFMYDEMESRYKLMTDRSFSQKIFSTSNKEFPQILFIIDEFADLIMQDTDKVFYNLLCKLSQKCRAAGIYCVLATQRPSVDVLSGSIKANFPARISCQVASGVDSKVILDTPGAELLAGRGDAIIKNYKYNYQRFQIAYSDPEEVCERYGK